MLSDLVSTVMALEYRFTGSGHYMAVGHRVDFITPETRTACLYDVFVSAWCREQYRELLGSWGQDYFLMDNVWVRDVLLGIMPDAWVGGVIFDNWLTTAACYMPGMVGVDVSRVTAWVHFAGKNGGAMYASHASVASAHNRQVHDNRTLISNLYACGKVDAMRYFMVQDGNHNLQFIDRLQGSRSEYPGAFWCHGEMFLKARESFRVVLSK